MNGNNSPIVSVPETAVIDRIEDEIQDVRTFFFTFDDPAVERDFKCKSGQFIMCTVFGAGEFAVSLPFSPEGEKKRISVRKVGKVTNALHELKVGDRIGVRGPFGNSFPFESIKGKNVVYVAGGIGIMPLRSSIVNVLQHQKDFGRVLLFYGARSARDLMYKETIREWEKNEGFETNFSIDRPEPGWNGPTGFVNTLVAGADIPAENTVAFVCGPPVMFNSVIKELKIKGVKEDMIFSTLERHMKCGIGKCQHCAIGRTLVCIDGPVYSYKQIRTLGEHI